MRPSTRRRLIALVAVATFGLAVTFAVADNFTLIGPRTVEPTGEVSPPLEDATSAPSDPSGDELGAYAGGLQQRLDGASEPDKKRCKADKRCEKNGRGGDDEDGDETETVAALIPAGSGGGGDRPALPCTDTNSCVGRLEALIPYVRDRVAEQLPRIRECTSSIGGEATCFDFGNGNYLVGDAPQDGQAEIGFCTKSGYYHVSAPALDGGAGAACPDDPAGEADGEGDDPPTARECTSSSGGQAKCFDFGDGKYIVSDPPDDGEGELGFCTGSGYYYVSAPSAEGGAGVECPDAPAAD